MYASLVGLGASGTGVTGIFGLLLCLHDSVHYIIMMVVSVGVSFALTWFFGFQDAKTSPEKSAQQKEINLTVECQPGTVYAPVSGSVFPSEEIPDATFSAGVLGRGVGINPTEGVVVAPFDGEISFVTDTKHAVGVTSADGMELLIHVGVDTVAMAGEGFECFVQNGQKVKTGEMLITFDQEAIKQAGHPDCVAVLLSNSAIYPDLSTHCGDCHALDKVIQV